MHLNKEDPRLTEYALGEMHPREAEKFEKALQQSPEALKIVEEIRGTSHYLKTELAKLPHQKLTTEQRQKILQHRLSSSQSSNKTIITPLRWGRRPRILTAGAIAACLCLLSFSRGQRTTKKTSHACL